MSCNDCREVEGKYFVEDFNNVKEALRKYNFTTKGTEYEMNHVEANDTGGMVRVRYSRSPKGYLYFLTIKGEATGPNKMSRFEFEREITQDEFGGIRDSFINSNESIFYQKKRESYTSELEEGVTVCLDELSDLEHFVEIEANSEKEVEKWKQRLGIYGKNIRTPYWRMK